MKRFYDIFNIFKAFVDFSVRTTFKLSNWNFLQIYNTKEKKFLEWDLTKIDRCVYDTFYETLFFCVKYPSTFFLFGKQFPVSCRYVVKPCFSTFNATSNYKIISFLDMWNKMAHIWYNLI